jgi:Spy/CpxP family protein refolding chaperone
VRKILTLSLLAALAIAAPTLAQGLPPGGPGGPGGPAPGGGPQAGPPPETVLKDVLGLSDDQVTALKSALDARKQAADALMPQLTDAEKTLADALKTTSPDATQLGTLLLKVQAVRTQLDQVNDAFKTAFAKLCTGAQQQKVTDILTLQKSLQAGQALQHLGVV